MGASEGQEQASIPRTGPRSGGLPCPQAPASTQLQAGKTTWAVQIDRCSRSCPSPEPPRHEPAFGQRLRPPRRGSRGEGGGGSSGLHAGSW